MKNSTSDQPQERATTLRTILLRYPHSPLIFIGGMSIVCMVTCFLAPSPIKEWALAGFLISVATLILYRTANQFLDDAHARETLPYTVATFLVLVPFAVWGRGNYQFIAGIVYIILVVLSLFYSTVWAIVDDFKQRYLR